ncbi:MAG: NAD-glutamate dehydrogenase [Alphaproteobacteria bacterium]
MTKAKKSLASLIKEAGDLLPASAQAGTQKMLEIMAGSIVPGDLEFFDANILSQMALSHWEMTQQRRKGKPALRSYCPHVEEGKCRKTVIDIVSDDMAFLIDSVVAEVNKHNLLIAIVIHPYTYVSFDKSGKIKDICDSGSQGYHRQSHIHIQIDSQFPQEVCEALETGLYQVLEDVFHTNVDWENMLNRMSDTVDELNSARTDCSAAEIHEHCAFLDYLGDSNFTFLGYREYKFTKHKGGLKGNIVAGSGLGVLREDIEPAYICDEQEGLPRNLQEAGAMLPPVSVSKTVRVSSVHRCVPMDCISIKTYDDKGQVVGEKIFIGLFTSVTYSRSLADIPYLREKVKEVMKLSGYIPGSHNARALRHILEKYPRDELFQLETTDILETGKAILRLQERQRIALFLRKGLFGRYISCLVFVPRDRFGTPLRIAIQEILEEETGGHCNNFYTNMDDTVFTQVMFVLSVVDNDFPEIDAQSIEKRLREVGQTWQERLTQALMEAGYDEGVIVDYHQRYGEAFPASYVLAYRARQCVYDIERVEQAYRKERIVLDLYRPKDVSSERVRLKIFHLDQPVMLSDVMPILENMGIRAISEVPYEVSPAAEERSLWIHDFLLETPEFDKAVVIDDVKRNFGRAFEKIWYREVEDDALNRLVLAAGATWQEITILRAYVRYIKQLGFPFSLSYIAQALGAHPKAAGILIDLFKAYHDPANSHQSDILVAQSKDAMEQELSAVHSSDFDKILRTIMDVIEATMRTNYFQCGTDGALKDYLSFKFDSAQVPFMPKPVPYREVFVYSPRMEGVHLRGDKIARGGLRWSDRHEDFRTEVLGLMKAQMVKNAVIVPMGSKGGFVVKTPSDSREAYMEEGVACYKTFISGLLDITDNQKGGKIIPPKDVVRRDGDDPYLVVAADKGTATFSDIANGLAQEYGFWLGDAFASGGSAGYDHKKMGITARGAWESVKHHFRLLGHDTQTQSFDVVGIGDMGGDVFGNGMLLSEHIQLVGAFNHMHIFCDPDPDIALSYKERQRLFDGGKGWGDYDTEVLSSGGRIFKRSEKLLSLTPQIKERFDLEKDKVTPEELISALLRARTDLLWFGGIGTYIKASRESNAQADDKANDAVRVDASQVRARVIGEGANLALTLLSRVELAKRGVSLNTDFIDNSAGVDSSDHEVNIKILLRDVMAQKSHDMDIKARNALLEQMTDEVAAHVLQHNYQQAQAVSMIESRAHADLPSHEAFIQYLEREQGVSRKLEGLPDSEEIEKRSREGRGLTRPELCSLLAYAKIDLTKALLASDIPDNAKMNYWVLDYFPNVLAERYEKEILRHRLKREIIATMIANSMIDRMGITFLPSMMDSASAGIKDVMEAYLITRDVFGLRHLWRALDDVNGHISAQMKLQILKDISSLAERGISWFLTRLGRDMDIDADVEEFRVGVKSLIENIDSLVTKDLKLLIEKRKKDMIDKGLCEDVARYVAVIPALSCACDIIRMAKEHDVAFDKTARVYYEVGERFHVYWMRQKVRVLPRENRWLSEAADGLLEQLYASQAGITRRVLRDLDDKSVALDGDALVEQWIEGHRGRFEQVDLLYRDIEHAGSLDLTMLTVAEQRLRGLYGG